MDLHWVIIDNRSLVNWELYSDDHGSREIAFLIAGRRRVFVSWHKLAVLKPDAIKTVSDLEVKEGFYPAPAPDGRCDLSTLSINFSAI